MVSEAVTEGIPRKLKKWIAVVGRWTFDNDCVTYLGPEKDGAFPFGICLSDVFLAEGELAGSIEIKQQDTPTGGAAGRFLIGYRSPSERYITVGLGGYGRAYVLAEYLPEVGWTPKEVAGSASSLTGAHSVGVRIHGQRMTLNVDDVRVFETVMDFPLPTGQAGLFAWGNHPIEFKSISVRQLPARVFVVMQFSDPYQQLYLDVIQPVAREFGLEAYHVGELAGPGTILNDIVQGLVESKIIIAEITPPNQNVFYELGYAHALGKPTILLAERGKQLPFDITQYRCLFYDNTIGGKKAIEQGLRKHFRAILHDWSGSNGNGLREKSL